MKAKKVLDQTASSSGTRRSFLFGKASCLNENFLVTTPKDELAHVGRQTQDEAKVLAILQACLPRSLTKDSKGARRKRPRTMEHVVPTLRGICSPIPTTSLGIPQQAKRQRVLYDNHPTQHRLQPKTSRPPRNPPTTRTTKDVPARIYPWFRLLK